MATGSSDKQRPSMTSQEALARLQEDDFVGVSDILTESTLTRRSSEQAVMVSGRADGSRVDGVASLRPRPSLSTTVSGAELLDSADFGDLEVTPNWGGRRGDTMPEWMLANDEPVSAVSASASLSMVQPRRSGRGLGVLALALVAAGTWWFAADGVKNLGRAAPAVVAAAPALAAAPAAPAPAAPSIQAAEIMAKEPVIVGAEQPKPEKQASPEAKSSLAAHEKVSSKRRAVAKKRKAPVAPSKAARGSTTSVTGLRIGAAASGSGCRALGSIKASEQERVNLCFKVKPSKGLNAVVVQWRHNGSVVRSTEHDLSGARNVHSIRAFSRVQSGQSGAWTVQVRTPQGEILASKRFTVGM